jgi:NADP-dependent 3-hydroxy acid dehydrogenase YdfG
MLGERAIVLPDLSQLSEGIAAIISALEGMSASDISSTYKGSKALVTTVVQDLIPLSKS